jgi:hypothetical protein
MRVGCPLGAKSSREQVQQNPVSKVSLFDHQPLQVVRASRVSAACYLQRRTRQILLEQIE